MRQALRAWLKDGERWQATKLTSSLYNFISQESATSADIAPNDLANSTCDLESGDPDSRDTIRDAEPSIPEHSFQPVSPAGRLSLLQTDNSVVLHPTPHRDSAASNAAADSPTAGSGTDDAQLRVRVNRSPSVSMSSEHGSLRCFLLSFTRSNVIFSSPSLKICWLTWYRHVWLQSNLCLLK